MTEWFRMSDLRVDRVTVRFLTPNGPVLGSLRIARNGRRQYRLRFGGRTEDVPRHWEPWAWQPVGAVWPEAKPEPITSWAREMTFEPPQRTTVPREPSDAIPKVPMGPASKPPQTLLEAEARILTAIRTGRHMDRLMGNVGPSGYGSSWPADFVAAAQALTARLAKTPRSEWPGFRIDDYSDIFIEPPSQDAIPSRWHPEARDVGDHDAGILRRWAGHLSRNEWTPLLLRAALPSWSWTKIAEDLKTSRSTAWKRYRSTIASIFHAAAAE